MTLAMSAKRCGQRAPTTNRLAPGLLLILILSGGNYHVSPGEVLGFIVMSILASAIAGAALAGAAAFVAGMFLFGFHAWAGRKRTAKG